VWTHAWGQVIALVGLFDQYDNDNTNGLGGNAEALYVHGLSVSNGSFLALNGFNAYTESLSIEMGGILDLCGGEFWAAGDVESSLDGWLDTRRIDSELREDFWLDAVYDPGVGWTSVQGVPEPAALALLAFGGLVIVRRRKALAPGGRRCLA